MIGIGYLILGILVLFFPGFLLSFLLFSGTDSLNRGERIAVSVGLSALVDMIIVTILSQPSLSAMRLMPFILGVVILCVVSVIIIFVRKESLNTLFNFFSHSESNE